MGNVSFHYIFSFPNSISVLDFPYCVVHELPELTAESLVRFLMIFLLCLSVTLAADVKCMIKVNLNMAVFVFNRKQETTISSAGGICSPALTC